MDQQIFEQVDDYISNLLAPEDAVLTFITQKLEKDGIFNMSISPNQGKLLQVLVKSCQAKRILELGTFAAYSTIWLARTLPPDGVMITIEFDEGHAKMAQQHIDEAELSDIVRIKTGRALHILPEFIAAGEAPFDLIFIDADKPPYTEYFQLALQLSRPGSIIICDNVVRNGQVLNKDSADEKVQGVRRLNQFVSECKAVTATILQTVGAKEYDGMLIAIVN